MNVAAGKAGVLCMHACACMREYVPCLRMCPRTCLAPGVRAGSRPDQVLTSDKLSDQSRSSHPGGRGGLGGRGGGGGGLILRSEDVESAAARHGRGASRKGGAGVMPTKQPDTRLLARGRAHTHTYTQVHTTTYLGIGISPLPTYRSASPLKHVPSTP